MSVIAFSPAVQPRDNEKAAVHALRGQLQSLREVIAALPSDVYCAAPSPVSGSIGGHVRHCLDHVRALTGLRGSSDLTYDSRLRGTPVESDPWAAVGEIDRLDLQIERFHVIRPGGAVRLRAMTERDGTEVHVQSTIGRELAFVIQHTIHHAAIIAVLLGQIGVAVPAGFGYAPSTLAHR
jgi:hypothetical protein